MRESILRDLNGRSGPAFRICRVALQSSFEVALITGARPDMKDFAEFMRGIYYKEQQKQYS